MTDADSPLQDIATLRGHIARLGGGPRHEAHLLRSWAQARPWVHPVRAPLHFLPRRLREAWPGIQEGLDALATLRSRHPAADSSERLLVGLADGAAVEAVLLPRGGLCVSSQVGCAVGCTFCMTGVGGLQRQLGSAEIVAQVALARRLRAVDKVVFMGMGEPAHNLEAVLEAIELLGMSGGIGHKNLVFSTVGDERAFIRLPQGVVKPALALSLHSTDAARRAELLPRAPRMTPAALIEAADNYARSTGYPAQIQWTLLAGVNDGDNEVEALIGLLRGRKAMLNLIPWNRVDGLPWRRPDPERAAAMARTLNRAGVLTRLRQSAGQDVEGGCGQLRARHEGVARIALPPRRASRRAAPGSDTALRPNLDPVATPQP
jgi:23S rRNA (adenine2503-C2)-methyltransferase